MNNVLPKKQLRIPHYELNGEVTQCSITHNPKHTRKSA